MKNMKLNLGCGNQTPQEWINVDYSLGAQLFKIPLSTWINKKIKLFNITWNDNIIIHDLRKKFPWSDNSVDIVYSSHTLEHLSKDEGNYFLQECYRVLKNRGTIRIIVPDLKVIIKQYTEEKLAAEDLIDRLEVGYSKPHDRPWKQVLAPLINFPHKCMYDTESLIKIMSEIGFECRAEKALESNIPDIKNIELLDRTQDAVIVEGQKV